MSTVYGFGQLENTVVEACYIAFFDIPYERIIPHLLLTGLRAEGVSEEGILINGRMQVSNRRFETFLSAGAVFYLMASPSVRERLSLEYADELRLAVWREVEVLIDTRPAVGRKIRVTKTVRHIYADNGLICTPGMTGTIVEHPYSGVDKFYLVEFDSPLIFNDFPLDLEEFELL